MPTELGAHVHTSDGQDVGTIDRLILDPTQRRVKAAVIRKGVVLPRDVEVPVDALQPQAGGDVRLSATAAEVADLPLFDESLYTGVPPAEYLPMYGYPETGFYWPLEAGSAPLPPGATPPEFEAPTGPTADAEGEEARRLDRENAVIREGSAVVSQDDHQIGSVEQLVFDAQSGQLSHLLVRRGIIFTKTFDLPADLIARVDDDIVTLSVGAHKMAELADEARAHAGHGGGTVAH
jgi:sporulation protein YlmC with PRC-barrel domain